MRGPRSFVFVSPAMADAFRREWRDIDRRFPPLGEAPEGMSVEEHWQNLATLRNAARAELREALRRAAQMDVGGIVPIPV